MRAASPLHERIPGAVVAAASGVVAGVLAMYLGLLLLGMLIPTVSPGAYHQEHGVWTRVTLALLSEMAVGIAIGGLFRRQPLPVAAVAVLVQVVLAQSGNDHLLLAMQSAALLTGTLLAWWPSRAGGKWVRAVAKVAATLVVTIVVVAFFVRWYGPHRSQEAAVAFCGSIGVGQDMAGVLEQARLRRMRHAFRTGSGNHEFWVDGALGAYSSCEIRFERGKVARNRVNDYKGMDSSLVTTLERPSD